MPKILVLFLALVLLSGCGKNSDEKTSDAILSANIALSKGNCQDAIDDLESIGRQNNNSHYLKTLAAGYACRAGYSVVTFFSTDLPVSSTPAPLGGVTKYTTSQVTVTGTLQADPNFVDLQKAIDVLFYAGGISTSVDPTSVLRARSFNSNDAADINSQLVFMMFAQLGKYMEVYADAGTTGVKGSGALTNNCFTDYSNVPAAVSTSLSHYPGACTVTNSPHPALDSTLVSVATRRTRMCQGIILVNGILDILPSVVASAGGGDLSVISGLTANITALENALKLANPSIGNTLTVLSQSSCETDPSITTATLESYFAIIFEALIQ